MLCLFFSLFLFFLQNSIVYFILFSDIFSSNSNIKRFKGILINYNFKHASYRKTILKLKFF